MASEGNVEDVVSVIEQDSYQLICCTYIPETVAAPKKEM